MSANSYTIEVRTKGNDASVELGLKAISQKDAVNTLESIARRVHQDDQQLSIRCTADWSEDEDSGDMYEVIATTELGVAYTIYMLGPDALTVFHDFEIAMRAVYNRDVDKFVVIRE